MSSSTGSSSESGRVVSIAVLVGSSPHSGGGPDATTVPLVVWTLMEKARAAAGEAGAPSKHTHDLVYYEFLDDTAGWNHLDRLLLQLCDTNDEDGDTDGGDSPGPPDVHLGSTERLEKDTPGKPDKPGAARARKLLGSLERFLGGRLGYSPDGSTPGKVHRHPSVPVDASRVEDSLSALLIDDEGCRLAVRGDVKLSRPAVRQGLALWLRSQGLYGEANHHRESARDLEGSLRVRSGSLRSCLAMDATAARAVHLLPPANEGEAVVVGGTPSTSSLWGLLSGPCLTAMGRKRLRVWLRQPLVDAGAIADRQDAVGALLAGTARDSLRDGLRPLGGNRGNGPAKLGPALARYRREAGGDDGDDADADETNASDGTAAVGRIVDTKKPLEVLYHLYVLASHHLPHLLECMEPLAPGNGGGGQGSSLLAGLYEQTAALAGQLERSVGLAEAVLDLAKAPDDFLVRAGYDEELGEVHRELEAVRSAVKDEHERVQDAWNEVSPGRASQVRLERVEDQTAWQFRLPDANDSKNVREAGRKIQVHRILKNGVYFSSLELRELSARYRDLRSEHARLSRRIVRDAMAIAATYAGVVERVADTIGTLDVFCALAHTAAMSPHGYCRPTVTDSDEDGAGIRLREARHPCVELQENMEYIPNDIDLTFPGAQLLVSGPNMGGKSVYIRSLGAIVCMAQIGSYVPCESATINVCHSILARVGAGDLQERGISTFMAEMLESSSMLRAATKRSLVIIDELGRGTSTFDGYGLARAILEYLRDRVGCMVVFATHFHELTHLEGVKNCHVTARKGSQGLTFLYKVRPGPCLESFGIQVAEMAHVPRAVIEDARKRARELERFVDAGAEGGAAAGGDAKAALRRFAGLDLPSVVEELSTLAPEAKRARLLSLVSP
ncbi:unnamed protein product [Pseudo-nitzschia multistriata]|uniref:DNA mismatch repair proteins mutS family domain-containing protein n=1 Tax=Pseudo-nitzschia multistriata TaxID=183589 RepID=A0A448ZH84_9STRA|nr:unnamed protein product [Pseudo-nitzschia multistriata]